MPWARAGSAPRASAARAAAPRPRPTAAVRTKSRRFIEPSFPTCAPGWCAEKAPAKRLHPGRSVKFELGGASGAPASLRGREDARKEEDERGVPIDRHFV